MSFIPVPLSSIVIAPVYVTFPLPSLAIPILVFAPIPIFPVTIEFIPLAYTPIALSVPTVMFDISAVIVPPVPSP